MLGLPRPEHRVRACSGIEHDRKMHTDVYVLMMCCMAQVTEWTSVRGAAPGILSDEELARLLPQQQKRRGRERWWRQWQRQWQHERW